MAIDSPDPNPAPSRPRVIVTMTAQEALLEPLVEAGVEIIRLPGPTAREDSQQTIADSISNTAAILTQGDIKIDGALLTKAPHLKIVANMSRGYDNLDLDAMTSHGVWATNVPDAFTAPTAEVTLGLLLMLMRRLGEGSAHVRNGEWTHFEPGRWDGVSLTGKTFGIIGYGNIGRAVAKRARAFDMEILATGRRPIEDPDVTHVSLDDLLARSDVVSLHAPLTPETEHLIDARRLGQMKRSAILINTARGKMVDEAALTAALIAGTIAGAGLDVTEDEPHVAQELYSLPNVVITPHLGGGTQESRIESQQHAVANVVAVLNGGQPSQPLNQPRSPKTEQA